MNSREMLLSLIDRYILEEADRRKQYNDNQVMIDLYNEVLKILKGDYQEIKDNSLCISILFDTIYHNDIYYEEFYSLLLRSIVDNTQRREFKKFVWKISNEMLELEKANEELKKQIYKDRHTVSSANIVKLCFKYNNPIKDSKDILNIKRIISYYEMIGIIDNKEELLLINEIEFYNRNVAVDTSGVKRDVEYTKSVYDKIPNILQAGFQEHDEIQVLGNRKGTLDKFVKEIMATIKNMDNDEIVYVLESYKKYKIDDNEYNYIINGVMNSYVSDLLVFSQYLLEKEVYSKRSERTYAVVNPIKAYLIEDMGDISYEDYQAVYELIQKFRDGSILVRQQKKLADNKNTSNAIELVHDQVRVVIRHVKDNIYCVMGVFAKKATNKRETYDKLRNRMIPDISNKDLFDRERELDEYNDKQLEELVVTKARKGTR